MTEGTRQTTVARHAEAEGIALHGGGRVRVRLLPAPADTGIVFVRADQAGAPCVRAIAEAIDAFSLQRRTELVGEAETRVATTEHLLAACRGLGLDNAMVELDGPELPIFDGSAQPFVELIDRAGLKELDAERRWWRLRRPVTLVDKDREIMAVPADTMQLVFFAQLTHAGMHNQGAELELGKKSSEENFRKIAPARTFVFYEDVENLRNAGLIRGGSTDCAIVLKEGKPLPEQGDYRLPNELACHKLLDLLGDLALLGRPVRALITARGSGHAMHQAFMEQLGKELD